MRKTFTMLSLLVALSLILTACGGGGAATQAPAEKVTLTIESWRNDDLSIWSDKIIPAFEAKYPNIHVVFAPTAPADYNGVLDTKLQGGTAGDLITCRPFDASLKLFQEGYLASLSDLPGMENFGSVAKSAWITDDGKDAFCVPMASVIHGFFYNKDIFDKYGLKEPTTRQEFFDILQGAVDNFTVCITAYTQDEFMSDHLVFPPPLVQKNTAPYIL